MIVGSMTAAREATIPLQVSGPTMQRMPITAVIDTGFTGWLTLPPVPIASLALPRIRARRATLADGSDVNLNLYRATVLLDGQARDVFATPPLSVLDAAASRLARATTGSANRFNTGLTPILIA